MVLLNVLFFSGKEVHMKGVKIAVALGLLFVMQAFFIFGFFDILTGGNIEMEGGSGGGSDIVEVALAEVKDINDGGRKFWTYMGFTEHQEWCACFVSWCGEQCGYYNGDGGIMPKSAVADDFRIFYQNQDRWKDGQAHSGDYIPQKGDFILFQWDGDSEEKIDHVGIVTDCDGQTVNTVEGNSGDKVKCKEYALSNKVIIGYGVPNYPKIGIMGTGGHMTDGTNYTLEEMNLIYACVQQEDGQSYEGALAVISTVMNRVDSPEWSFCGRNALEQLKAPGQFCYSIDDNWKAWLDGNVQDYVKKAVDDCLKEGIRNHDYTSFRTNQGSHTGGEYIPDKKGNYYFNE